MRPIGTVMGLALPLLALAGCGGMQGGSEVERAIAGVNAIDENNLNDIMLTAAAPDEAVSYFRDAAAEQPDRIDLRRGLASSLVRARRATEAVGVWERVVAHPEATDTDHVEYADALIRDGDWAEAERILDAVPPTHETYERYRLEAMIADSNQEWDRADSFYETAAGLTTQPAGVYNNWGYSLLTRGDHRGAEELFIEAIGHDNGLFTAKNNLVLARAAQGNYQLPLITMTQVERAQLLHTAAIAAVRRGEVQTGRGLLAEAIDTHPRHFEEAVRAHEALEAGVTDL